MAQYIYFSLGHVEEPSIPCLVGRYIFCFQANKEGLHKSLAFKMDAADSEITLYSRKHYKNIAF